jgi:hypothetical protein
MSKQSALQWYIEQCETSFKYNTLQKDGYTIAKEKITKQALEMEREQIEEAYGDGLNAHRVDFCNRNEYYQKTYGKVK